MFLKRLISMEEDLPLTSTLFLGEAPEDLSISMLLIRNMVGKEDCYELDIVVELKVEGKINLFAIFLISATMQDSGKRKRSVVIHLFIIQKKIKKKTKQN